LTKIIFDTNVYHKIADDKDARLKIRELSESDLICIISTPKIIDELIEGPFGGLPDWFPIDFEPESVFVLDHARLDMARLGDGEIYREHRGESKQIEDAIISDSAADLADILVSDDKRLIKRFNDLRTRCTGMNYSGFREWLFSEAAKGRSAAH